MNQETLVQEIRQLAEEAEALRQHQSREQVQAHVRPG